MVAGRELRLFLVLSLVAPALSFLGFSPSILGRPGTPRGLGGRAFGCGLGCGGNGRREVVGRSQVVSMAQSLAGQVGEEDGGLLWKVYDADAIGAYYSENPLQLARRVAHLATCFVGAASSITLSLLQGQWGRPLIDSSAKAMADALAEAGPTYSKFGQALSCRPDLVGEGVAAALQELQDRVPAFDHQRARNIVEEELGGAGKELLDTMGTETVAAATLGQVYRAKVGDKTVALKVQRPGVMEGVAADSLLVRSAASVLEKLKNPISGERLLKPALVQGCDEFFSRLFEESDYEREAANLAKFAAIYGGVEGRGGDSRIIVPNLFPELSTKKVITMEWVEGQRLSEHAMVDSADLPTLRLGIECSLSQCLETGVMHADPHGGNLLKCEEGGLAYLDFGMVSEVPEQVREGLLRAVAYTVAGEYGKVAELFGDLMLIPQEIVDDPEQLEELTEALSDTANAILERPDPSGGGSSVPTLRFDRLIGAIAAFAPRFQFQLPPYFLNNARAIGTLEGLAKSADPSFNLLSEVYSFAIRQLFTSNSPGMRKTLKDLTYDPVTGRPDFKKVKELIQEASLISGKRKRRIVWDTAKTGGGRRFAARVLWDATTNR